MSSCQEFLIILAVPVSLEFLGYSITVPFVPCCSHLCLVFNSPSPCSVFSNSQLVTVARIVFAVASVDLIMGPEYVALTRQSCEC